MFVGNWNLVKASISAIS